MWTRLKRNVMAPMRLLGMLHQIQVQQQETNLLLRELLLALTGKLPRTGVRGLGSRPVATPDPPTTGSTIRKRTASDVWTRTEPKSPQEQARSEREAAAEQPLDPPSENPSSPSARTGNA